ISILVAENPNALAASYKLPAGTMPNVANRLKMAKTSNVIALVEAGGKLYSATKEVKVTVGRCGGERDPARRNQRASSIRVRAAANGDTTEVQALIQHPMDSGYVKDAKGEIIPPHFIQVLTFEYDGKPVFVADWGGGVSKDPYVKFAFKGGKKDGGL